MRWIYAFYDPALLLRKENTMRKTLLFVALTCLPALANIPFGETTVIDNPNVMRLTGFPQLPGLVPQVLAPGVTFSIQVNTETPDYAIVIAAIETQDGETKKYTALRSGARTGIDTARC